MRRKLWLVRLFLRLPALSSDKTVPSRWPLKGTLNVPGSKCGTGLGRRKHISSLYVLGCVGSLASRQLSSIVFAGSLVQILRFLTQSHKCF